MSWRDDRAEADRLFSLIIRARDRCERCLQRGVPFDTAHIIRRSYNATRCRLSNAWCLCRPCHQLVDSDAVEHARLVARTIGSRHLAELVKASRSGLSTFPTLFWRERVEFLTTFADDLGITTEA